MLIEVPPDIPVEAVRAFFRDLGHGMRETNGIYKVLPLPPRDNIKRAPSIRMYSLRETAQRLNMPDKHIYDALRATGAINSRNQLTDKTLSQRGLLYYIERQRPIPGTDRTEPYSLTVATDRGIEWIKTIVSQHTEAAS